MWCDVCVYACVCMYVCVCVCICSYEKPIIRTKFNYFLAQKFGLVYTYTQLQALQALYVWRENIARKYDESTGCVCVCMCVVCMCVCVYVCACVCMCVHAYILCECTCVYVVFSYADAYYLLWPITQSPSHTYVERTHTYTHIHTPTHTHTHVRTHTYTHTHTSRRLSMIVTY